jgi:hypothetical protein
VNQHSGVSFVTAEIIGGGHLFSVDEHGAVFKCYSSPELEVADLVDGQTCINDQVSFAHGFC